MPALALGSVSWGALQAEPPRLVVAMTSLVCIIMSLGIAAPTVLVAQNCQKCHQILNYNYTADIFRSNVPYLGAKGNEMRVYLSSRRNTVQSINNWWRQWIAGITATESVGGAWLLEQHSTHSSNSCVKLENHNQIVQKITMKTGRASAKWKTTKPDNSPIMAPTYVHYVIYGRLLPI